MKKNKKEVYFKEYKKYKKTVINIDGKNYAMVKDFRNGTKEYKVKMCPFCKVKITDLEFTLNNGDLLMMPCTSCNKELYFN